MGTFILGMVGGVILTVLIVVFIALVLIAYSESFIDNS